MKRLIGLMRRIYFQFIVNATLPCVTWHKIKDKYLTKQIFS